MKIKDFFRMEYTQILIHFIFLGLLEVLLFIFEVNYFLMIYLLLIGLILEGVYLCQRYMKKYRYYKNVKTKLDMMEQKCMITEMLELPDFSEGVFLYETLQMCNKSMNDEILKYKTEAAGYREYIEMWIHEVKTPLAAAKLILENHPSEITQAMDEEMQQNLHMMIRFLNCVYITGRRIPLSMKSIKRAKYIRYAWSMQRKQVGEEFEA